MKSQLTTDLSLHLKFMADACSSSYNLLNYPSSFCPAYFDRIACWPPTSSGIRRVIPCPKYMFPNANSDAYASRLCTNQSRWEDRSHYELCIGCTPNNTIDLNFTNMFSIPSEYILSRKYFVISADILSISLLTIGILILLGNSRLRQCSRNILHLNIFFVFLIRSFIQLIAELYMSKGYFAHNVFERIDACNRTTTYFNEDHLLDCKLFTIVMNYINSGVAHWFVFCEAMYLYRLLRSKTHKTQVRWYIIIGWLVPLILTTITYITRYILKKDLYTCWFEPSIYDWILHGPNVVLQFLNFLIFNYICILLVRKLNKTYQIPTSDRTRFAKYSRLARSTLILLPLFGIHYFLFMWNTKPLLISNLILIHLTVHTIASSLQGIIVALVYTIFNSEVQREIFRSLNRCLIKHYPTWEQPAMLHNLLNKFEDEHLYSLGCHQRLSTPDQYRRINSNLFVQNSRDLARENYSLCDQNRDDSINIHKQELNRLNDHKR